MAPIPKWNKLQSPRLLLSTQKPPLHVSTPAQQPRLRLRCRKTPRLVFRHRRDLPPSMASPHGNGICWINTVCYVVSIKNFPSNRQVAVGLSTSYQGLSAKIYTDIVDAFFSSSPTTRAKAYLLLNSILPLVGCVIAAPFVRDVSVGITKRVEGGFIVMFVITITTGIYAVISSLGSISSKLSPVNNLIGLGVFLLAPLVVPLSEKIRDVLNKKGLIYREKRVCDFTIEEFDDGVERVLESGVKEGEDIGEEVREGAVMEEIGVKLMVRRVEFWLYFFVYICGATIGLVYLNNLGQIAESRGYSRTSSLVSLSSSFGFFGRLMPSLLDYCFSR
ncbi:hypothetical protein L1049_013274 [Liquidambar formosana]|uniref:Uncharacterized protein n=1 Tax=Liquidambar formosana TaxID=63359 RepID=A0AAP0WY53_LIQFO